MGEKASESVCDIAFPGALRPYSSTGSAGDVSPLANRENGHVNWPKAIFLQPDWLNRASGRSQFAASE